MRFYPACGVPNGPPHRRAHTQAVSERRYDGDVLMSNKHNALVRGLRPTGRFVACGWLLALAPHVGAAQATQANDGGAGAQAQSTTQAAAASVAGAHVAYESAFDSYVPMGASEVGSWQQANQVVDERGGWRAYAREAAMAAKAARMAASKGAQDAAGTTGATGATGATGSRNVQGQHGAAMGVQQ
jgi:hypothetical protein